jgi:hypothetical protein
VADAGQQHAKGGHGKGRAQAHDHEARNVIAEVEMEDGQPKPRGTPLSSGKAADLRSKQSSAECSCASESRDQSAPF